MSASDESSRGEGVSAADVHRALLAVADPERARNLARFFKSGTGEYGEGDQFMGVRVPDQRAVAKRFWTVDQEVLVQLLRSEWHEERLLALFCIVRRYQKRPDDRETLHRLYLENLDYVNNWDLVDASAEHIVGAHLDARDLRLLDRLADSESVWRRRISMMATFHFIKRNEAGPAIHVASRLVHDPHDLVQNAVGWMLREIGKRDRAAEEEFLQEHLDSMPRTMLRYAIERFPEPLRQSYLNGTVDRGSHPNQFGN